MASQDETRLMLQVARLYYEDNQTQEQIARTLGLSRPKVSRLLQQARKEGIVQITIVDPFATHSALAQQLVTSFDLLEAVVVPGGQGPDDLIRRRVGLAAARYLQRILNEGDTLGIGWGRTLHSMATALDSSRKVRVTIVPLIGGLGQVVPSFQVHELARLIAEAFDGVWLPFYAPAILDSEETRASLFQSGDIARMAASWKRVNVAFVGIGNVTFEDEIQMLFARYLDEKTQARLTACGAVGDICVRFFDIQGRPCADALPGVVGIDLDTLRQVPRVVGVAGGRAKAQAILGALRGRFINVLVTDEVAARSVLDLASHT